MFSNDKNVESIAQLIEKFRHYLELQSEYVKLDVTEKTVRLITVFSVIALTTIAAVAIMLFLSLAAAYALASLVGNGWAFSIVAVVYLVAFIIVIANRKRLIEKPLVKLLSNILLEK